MNIVLTKFGKIVISAIFLVLAIFMATAIITWISQDNKVASDQIHITCVDGATKLSDGTCMIKE
jgi:hypothetical protein